MQASGIRRAGAPVRLRRAIVGELLTGRPLTEAVRAGFGALLGALGGVLAKGIILIAIALIVIPRLL